MKRIYILNLLIILVFVAILILESVNVVGDEKKEEYKYIIKHITINLNYPGIDPLSGKDKVKFKYIPWRNSWVCEENCECKNCLYSGDRSSRYSYDYKNKYFTSKELSWEIRRRISDNHVDEISEEVPEGFITKQPLVIIYSKSLLENLGVRDIQAHILGEKDISIATSNIERPPIPPLPEESAEEQAKSNKEEIKVKTSENDIQHLPASGVRLSVNIKDKYGYIGDLYLGENNKLCFDPSTCFTIKEWQDREISVNVGNKTINDDNQLRDLVSFYKGCISGDKDIQYCLSKVYEEMDKYPQQSQQQQQKSNQQKTEEQKTEQKSQQPTPPQVSQNTKAGDIKIDNNGVWIAQKDSKGNLEYVQATYNPEKNEFCYGSGADEKCQSPDVFFKNYKGGWEQGVIDSLGIVKDLDNYYTTFSWDGITKLLKYTPGKLEYGSNYYYIVAKDSNGNYYYCEPLNGQQQSSQPKCHSGDEKIGGKTYNSLYFEQLQEKYYKEHYTLAGLAESICGPKEKGAWDLSSAWSECPAAIASFLSQWTYVFSGYAGLKNYFYSEEEEGGVFGIYKNELINAILGGVEGWSDDLFCKSYRNDLISSTNSGVGYNPGYSSIAVSVALEKIPFKNVSTGKDMYVYKLDYFVSAGSCENVNWNIYVYNKDGKDRKLYKENQKNNSIYKAGNSAIIEISEKNYEKVCIKFDSIKPVGCLVKDKPYEESIKICNKVASTEEYKLTSTDANIIDELFGEEEEEEEEAEEEKDNWQGFG